MTIPTSQLVLDLDASVRTGALPVTDGEYLKLPVTATPPAPVRAVLLYFSRGHCRYVLQRAGHQQTLVTLDCNRSALPSWIASGDGGDLVATLLAEEPGVVDDGPVQVIGELDPAMVAAISPDTVDGLSFWGQLELDLRDHSGPTRGSHGHAPRTTVTTPGAVTVEFALQDVGLSSIPVTIALEPDRTVRFSIGSVSWGWTLAATEDVDQRVTELLHSSWFRSNLQYPVREQLDGGLYPEITGDLAVDLSEHLPQPD